MPDIARRLIRRDRLRRGSGTQDVKCQDHSGISAKTSQWPQPGFIQRGTGQGRSDQGFGVATKARPPRRTLPMTNGPTLEVGNDTHLTPENPHDRHLPKTIHNITRTTLRFKTRRPSSTVNQPRKNHEETSGVSIPPPPFAPFCFRFPSCCVSVSYIPWRAASKRAPPTDSR